MSIRRLCTLGLAALIAVAAPACDDLVDAIENGENGNGENGVRELDTALFGEWLAISDVLVNAADASQEIDVIAELGVFVHVTVADDSTIAITEYWPDEGFHEIAGTWFTSGSDLVVEFEGEDPDTVTYQVTGDNRLVIGLGGTDWDFDDDGSDESAVETITFRSADLSPDPDLEGPWTADSFVFVSEDDPSVTMDLIAHGGAFVLTANADETYHVAQRFPDGEGGFEESEESGTYVALEGLLWVAPDHLTDEMFLIHYDVDGDTLVLTLYGDEFDFDGDGEDEAATIVITLHAGEDEDDGDTGELDPELFGEWVAISDVHVDAADSTRQFDLVTGIGTFLQIGFVDDGTITVVEHTPGEEWVEITGTWYTVGDSVAVDFPGEDMEMAVYAVTGEGRLVVRFDDADWDFDGDGTDVPTIETITFASADLSPDPDLEGTWTADSFVFVSDDDPSTSVDLLEDGGSITVTLNADGTYRVVQSWPDGEGGVDESEESGSYVALEGLLWLIQPEAHDAPPVQLYEVDGETLVMTVPNAEFDFDGDGEDEAATIVMTFSLEV